MRKYLLLVTICFFMQSCKSQTATEWNEKGNKSYESQNYPDAIKSFSKAIDLEPTYGVAYYNRGNAKRKMEDYRGSIVDYDNAIKFNVQDAYNNRGLSKSKLRDFAGAIEDFTKYIRLNPNNEGAYFNRGIAKNSVRDYEGAIDDFTNAIRLNPKDGLAYFSRAAPKLNLGDKEGACLDLSKAGELGYSAAYDLIKQECN